jgi:hypothetical protein
MVWALPSAKFMNTEHHGRAEDVLTLISPSGFHKPATIEANVQFTDYHGFLQA